MGRHALAFRAGKEAASRLRDEGFHHNLFTVMPGASGGPKWLVLSQLDRVIFGKFFKGRTKPLYCISSSIGGWRFSCAAQPDPVAAINQFETDYVNYKWPVDIDAKGISDVSRRMMRGFLGESGIRHILTHPWMRLSLVAVRMRGPLARLPGGLSAGVLLAALGNLASPRALNLLFERVIFCDPRDIPPFEGYEPRPTRHLPLTGQNFEDALMASSTIPVIMQEVRDIAGTRSGIYLDGGITDYHFDMDFTGPDHEGLILYPHFMTRIVPGWFDKALAWRKPQAENLSRMLLIAPTDDFISGFPGGKIPTRKDFKAMDNETRIRAWQQVLAECERLADEFRQVMETGDAGDRLQPIV